ncbi:MAG: histidine kinase [Bryobacterales bacterium]|nr:histidine kinase [Bryobacterales bacterium]
MGLSILSVIIGIEHDTVNARQRARQIARLVGFDQQDQTRISTAVSEIARNAFNYAGGGKVEFMIEGRTAPQLFIIQVTDNGPGIRHLAEILEGRYQSATGMGLGIIGARRLMDQFEILSSPGRGTTVLLKKLLPRRAPFVTLADLARIADTLAGERPQNAVQELQHQNGELLRALDELNLRQAELSRVNRELEDTNRGVVALYAELDEKADHLRRADELKSKFLSNMSHEFRSPLNSILALSALLMNRSDGELTRDQDQQVGYIRRAAHDLLELVNDLLDLAKVESGKLEVKPIEFEVANLFAALRGMLRPLLTNNQSVDLIFDDASHVPPLYSDEGKISQILRNFISNALKFTEHGTVRVSAEMENDEIVRFAVADTGIGIAPDDLEAIFQDFVQLDSPIQRKVKGTGLGLPLSKKLATTLGGSVEVKSDPPVGSVFTLRIPAQYAREREPASQLPASITVEPGTRQVVFVEDSPEDMMAYRHYLHGSEFNVMAASTTREAEDLLNHLEPVAIVLDILLRGEDAWPLMARLKQDPHTKKIPVIVVSAAEDQAKAFHLGADAYLLKPVTPEQLLGTLGALTQDPGTPSVLLIDDNELDRYLLRQHLRKLPFSIIEASTGKTGILRARETHPSLIFLDLSMADMTGVEVLDTLKSASDTQAIPVVIVSSSVLSEAERTHLMTKAAAILGKGGLRESSVVETVYRVLEIPDALEASLQ